MKCYKYNVNNKQDILLYSLNDDATFLQDNSELRIKKVEEVAINTLSNDNAYLPIFRLEDFVQSISPFNRQRTRDKILSEQGVETFKNLQDNYLLTRYKQSPLSSKVRTLAVEKYTEINNNLV